MVCSLKKPTFKAEVGEMRISLPIEPKPQSRPRFARRGNYVQTYEDRAMKEYKNQVKNYLRKSRAKLIEKGPISAHVTFYIHPPICPK
ncbi:hypothetical protein D347_00521 [Enterococcus faecalis LA3B-2]|nr:hypothetical protein D347_00521 [Enterococcus faecalis LA3B-2]